MAFKIFVIMTVTIHADADDVDADDHADDDDEVDADDDVDAHGDTDDVISDSVIATADDDAGNFDGAFEFWWEPAALLF